jgi:hypothetical protein
MSKRVKNLFGLYDMDSTCFITAIYDTTDKALTFPNDPMVCFVNVLYSGAKKGFFTRKVLFLEKGLFLTAVVFKIERKMKRYFFNFNFT